MSDYMKTDDAVSALTAEQYRVTQQNGTERPGTGEYLGNKSPGCEKRKGESAGRIALYREEHRQHLSRHNTRGQYRRFIVTALYGYPLDCSRADRHPPVNNTGKTIFTDSKSG